MSRKSSDLQDAIIFAHEALNNYSVDDKEYKPAAENLKILYEIKELDSKPPIDPHVSSALVTGLASIVGVAMLVVFELRGNVFTFRSALGKLPRP